VPSATASAAATAAPSGPVQLTVTTYETADQTIGAQGGADAKCGDPNEKAISGGYRIDEQGGPAGSHTGHATASYPTDDHTWHVDASNGGSGAQLILWVTVYCLKGDAGLVRSGPATAHINANGRGGTHQDCASGYVAGGGFRLDQSDSRVVVDSRPYLDATQQPIGWQANARDASGQGLNIDMYAVCATRTVTGAHFFTASISPAAGAGTDVTRACDDPQHQLLTGGGFDMPFVSDNQPDTSAEQHLDIFVSHSPVSAGAAPQTWKAAVYNSDTAPHPLRVWAECLVKGG
jgi:hypothetical protein